MVQRYPCPDTIPPRDPALIIGEGGAHYLCPDLEALAKHITTVTHRLDSTPTHFVRWLKMLERDRDLLLERFGEWAGQEREQETTT